MQPALCVGLLYDNFVTAGFLSMNEVEQPCNPQNSLGETSSHPRDAIRPSDAGSFAPKARAQGMPGAVAPAVSCAKIAKRTHTSGHRYNRTRPAFPARCLTTY